MARKEPLEETLARLYAGMSEEEILVAESERLANLAEGYDIRGVYNPQNKGGHWKHSKESRAKMTGNRAPRTEELKQHLRETMKGREVPEERKQNMVQGNLKNYIKRCQSIGIENPVLDGTMKVCFYCRTQKDIDEFSVWNNKAARWGRKPQCKKCARANRNGVVIKSASRAKLDEDERVRGNLDDDAVFAQPAAGPRTGAPDDASVIHNEVAAQIPHKKREKRIISTTPPLPEDAIPF